MRTTVGGGGAGASIVAPRTIPLMRASSAPKRSRSAATRASWFKETRFGREQNRGSVK